MCSRLSPSSSGYKSQSQRSDATISPSPSPSPVAAMTCSHTQVSSQDLVSPESNVQTVMWAVTNISSVPPGSIIINPQTNQPYTNADGTIYRFDPDNPPKFFTIENESSNMSNVSNKHTAELSEPSRMTSNSYKNDGKKQRSQTKINTVSATSTQVTNTATSPSLPFTPPPPPPPPPPPQNPPIPQQQQQQPPPQQQQQPLQPQPQQQNLVKSSSTVQMCSHNQTAQPYATYVPTSEPYNQGVYPPPMGQPTVMMAPHPTQGQASMQNGGQGDVLFNQNQVYANYAMPVHQGPVPQSGVSESREFIFTRGCPSSLSKNSTIKSNLGHDRLVRILFGDEHL